MKYLIILILVGAVFLLACTSSPENLDEFAQCLTEKGAEMYGSYTCPHCQEQKSLFGSSFQYIDYTECTENQQKCAQEEIQYLPTWKFADGTETSGVKNFVYLSEKTGCALS